MSINMRLFLTDVEGMPALLTTKQAADLLNVSEEYLIGLLDQGALPFTKIYDHIRIQRGDVLAYKKQRDTQREADLTELVRFTEDCGGYDELQKKPRFSLVHGESVAHLRTLPAGHYDAVITDPPYASGGLHIGSRQATTSSKYGIDRHAKFEGDARDQRSYMTWCSMWMAEALRVLKVGGYFLCFTDWRQLPTITDAIQCAGFTWRGVISWDKGLAARAPHKGYFRHQCEYVVWGTKGRAAKLEHDGPFPGSLTIPILPSEKQHQTGKPVALMEQLVRPVIPGGIILDPFAGSGTTGVAALRTGRSFVGIEQEAAYYKIARQRLFAAEAGL